MPTDRTAIDALAAELRTNLAHTRETLARLEHVLLGENTVVRTGGFYLKAVAGRYRPAGQACDCSWWNPEAAARVAAHVVAQGLPAEPVPVREALRADIARLESLIESLAAMPA